MPSLGHNDLTAVKIRMINLPISFAALSPALGKSHVYLLATESTLTDTGEIRRCQTITDQNRAGTTRTNLGACCRWLWEYASWMEFVLLTHWGRHLSHKISLKYVPQVLIDNMAALVQIMAWRRRSDKPLSEPMLVCCTNAYMRHSALMSWWKCISVRQLIIT